MLSSNRAQYVRVLLYNYCCIKYKLRIWKFKVKTIIVRDHAFEKTCEELKIEVIKWPKF